MSIEQNVERIAVALENLVELTKVAMAMPAEEGKKKKKTEAVAAVATGIEDMLGDGAAKPEEKITLDQVKDALRGHMTKNGAEVTKALMIKHGANAAKPVVTSIPEANYPALMKELG